MGISVLASAIAKKTYEADKSAKKATKKAEQEASEAQALADAEEQASLDVKSGSGSLTSASTSNKTIYSKLLGGN